jgi:hypothetical protein
MEVGIDSVWEDLELLRSCIDRRQCGSVDAARLACALDWSHKRVQPAVLSSPVQMKLRGALRQRHLNELL